MENRIFLVGQHGVSCESSFDLLEEAIKSNDEEHVFDFYIPENSIIEVSIFEDSSVDQIIYEVAVLDAVYNERNLPFDCTIGSQGDIVYTTDHGLFGAGTLRELKPGEVINTWEQKS